MRNFSNSTLVRVLSFLILIFAAVWLYDNYYLDKAEKYEDNQFLIVDRNLLLQKKITYVGKMNLTTKKITNERIFVDNLWTGMNEFVIYSENREISLFIFFQGSAIYANPLNTFKYRGKIGYSSRLFEVEPEKSFSSKLKKDMKSWKDRINAEKKLKVLFPGGVK